MREGGDRIFQSFHLNHAIKRMGMNYNGLGGN